MKKTIYLVFAIILIAAACKEKKNGTFVVKGEILHAPGKKVTLIEAPYTNEQPVILDSALLDVKGSFNLKGRANEEGIYRLVLENGPDVILVNDNSEITVHLDVNDYRNYKTEGSEASASLHTLFEDYHAKDSTILANFKAINELEKTPGKDSVVEAMKSINDKQVEGLNSLLQDFIKNNNSPAAVLYVLGIASQTIKPEELKAMVDVAAAKFPQHAGLTRVKTMLVLKRPAAETRTEAPSYALIGKQSPDLQMQGLDGKNMSISQFKGKFLLVDFWASWCGPCRQENPNVVTAYNKYKNKNFTILGVSLDQDKEAWQKAIAKDNLTWNHMSDLKQWESAAVPAFGFEGIPFNVLIDPSGKIIASGLRGEDLDRKLEEVLK